MDCFVETGTSAFGDIQLYHSPLLDPVEPLSFVNTPVLPIHLPVAMPVIVLEGSDVPGTVLPLINSLPAFLVIHVLAIIAVTVSHSPDPTAMSHP